MLGLSVYVPVIYFCHQIYVVWYYIVWLLSLNVASYSSSPVVFLLICWNLSLIKFNYKMLKDEFQLKNFGFCDCKKEQFLFSQVKNIAYRLVKH